MYYITFPYGVNIFRATPPQHSILRKAIAVFFIALLLCTPVQGAAASTISTKYSDRFQAPTRPFLIAKHFDNPAQPWLSGNRGLDLAVAEGAPVYASGDGTVTVARVIVNRPVVVIRHSTRLRTTYTHVMPKVSEGSIVKAGDVIGMAQGNFVEWGAKTGKKTYLNPLLLLIGQARLVPYHS